MRRPSMNKQEAAAFFTHCRWRGLSSAEALEIMAQSTWTASRGHKCDTRTVRRLVKPLLLQLDALHAAAAIERAEREADVARWVALPAEAKAEIRAAVETRAGYGMWCPVRAKSNKDVRNLASAHGIVQHARKIDLLIHLIDPRQPWNRGNE